MIKAIRILEVPVYLLVIALFCIENGSTAMGAFLILISVGRLFTNHITDSSVYKDER